MNRIRLYLHRLFRRPAITGPMPFYTRRLADGMALDLEAYFTYVVTAISDDADARALFDEVVADRELAREHDGWEPERMHMEKLAMYVGYEVPVRGKALWKLGERLLSAVPKPKPVAGNVVSIPAQREGEAAA